MLSLALSALVSGPQRHATAEEPESDRAREFLRRRLSGFYDFEGLFRWKRKFDPTFEDRFLIYPSPLSLPAVLLALVRVQSPEGLGALAGRAAGMGREWMRQVTGRGAAL